MDQPIKLNNSQNIRVKKPLQCNALKGFFLLKTNDLHQCC